MTRRGCRVLPVVGLLLALTLPGCRGESLGDAKPPDAALPVDGGGDVEEQTRTMEKVTKSDAAWRAQLTPEQYRVTRQAGTERAFTGAYWDTKTPGTYSCVCCGLELFSSDAKFASGCGWPSFFEALDGFHVTEHRDVSLGMVRTEVRCRRCDAHLGHVFDDGPRPTGMRYCINSAAIRLAKEEPPPGN